MGCGPSKTAPSVEPQADHAVSEEVSVVEPGKPPTAADGNTGTDAVPAAVLNNVEAPVESEGPGTALQPVTVMYKATELLRKLSTIPTDGSRAALGQAAVILLQQLEVADTISICATRPKSSVCIVGAAAGLGSSIIEQQLVSTDRQCSVLQVADQVDLAQSLYHTVRNEEDAAALPPDWAVLHAGEGLMSFLAVPVQSSGSLVGVVTVASRQPSAFQECWWLHLLDCVCPGVYHQLRHPLMVGLCALADRIENCPEDDYRAFIAMVLQQSAVTIESVTHLKLRVRLGLLSRDGSTAMVYHVTCKKGQTEEGTVVLHSARRRAAETVLREAVAAKTPRVVQDTGKYIHAVTSPGSDVLLDEDESAHSVVVLPFKLGNDAPFAAGIYVADSKPSDFAAVKLTVTNIAAMLGCMLAKHLQEGGLLTRMWDELPPAAAGAVQCRGDGAQCGPPDEVPVVASAAASVGPGAGGLVQRLQQQMRQLSLAHAQTQRQRHQYVTDLHLLQLLGKGGFGVVYRGTWLGSPAAIKVMTVPRQLRGVMKVALEMAVMQSLSHPNIVRVYQCLTDLVEEAGSSSGMTMGQVPVGPIYSPMNLRFREAAPDEDSPTCNLIIMEFCDMGNLHTALSRGQLHERRGEALTVNMWKLLTVLLEIARSVEQMHSMSIIHCDLKLANVLLKSSADSPLGFVCKLGDFGLAKVLTNARFYIINKSTSGTVTQLPPERFETGSRLTSAVDVYAFGMIMFQLFTRQRPFKGLPAAGIVQTVARGQRPQFPADTPADYRQLAEECWDQDPNQRPTAAKVVKRLQEMLQRAPVPAVHQ